MRGIARIPLDRQIRACGHLLLIASLKNKKQGHSLRVKSGRGEKAISDF